MGKQYGDGAVLPFRNVSSIRSCHQIIFQHIMVPIVLAALTTRDSFCYIRMNRTIRVSLGRGRNIKVLYHCACTLEVACITWILLPCHKICVISMQEFRSIQINHDWHAKRKYVNIGGKYARPRLKKRWYGTETLFSFWCIC